MGSSFGDFIKNIKKGAKEGLLDNRLLVYDLSDLADYLNTDRDLIFKYVGIRNIYDRYLTHKISSRSSSAAELQSLDQLVMGSNPGSE